MVGKYDGFFISPWGEISIRGHAGKCNDGTCLSQDIKVSLCNEVLYGKGIYTIDEVNGIALPPAKLKEKKEFSLDSHKETQFTREVLDEWYKREVNPHHITKEEKYALSDAKRNKDTDKPKDDYPLSSLCKLPELVVQLLNVCKQHKAIIPGESLEEYPLDSPKKVSLGSHGYYNGNILSDVLNNFGFFLYHGDAVFPGVMVYKKEIPTEFFEQKKYEEIVSDLTTGWKSCKLVNYTDIIHTQSEEDYDLFIKSTHKTNGFQTLFRYLSLKLGLTYNDDLTVNQTLKYPQKNSDMVYLWIKKDAFEKVVEKMNLKIEKPTLKS